MFIMHKKGIEFDGNVPHAALWLRWFQHLADTRVLAFPLWFGWKWVVCAPSPISEAAEYGEGMAQSRHEDEQTKRLR